MPKPRPRHKSIFSVQFPIALKTDLQRIATSEGSYVGTVIRRFAAEGVARHDRVQRRREGADAR